MTTLKSAELFEKMGPALAQHGKDVVAKVGAVFLFEIKANKDSPAELFTVDLKNGNGKSRLQIKADCSLLLMFMRPVFKCSKSKWSDYSICVTALGLNAS